MSDVGVCKQVPQEHLRSAAWSLVPLQEPRAAQEALPPTHRAQSSGQPLARLVALEALPRCQASLQVLCPTALTCVGPQVPRCAHRAMHLVLCSSNAGSPLRAQQQS